MHMIPRMHHCVRARTSYAAIRLRFATKAAAGNRLATFYLVPSVASPFLAPESYSCFLSLTLTNFSYVYDYQGCLPGAELCGMDEERKASQSKVCRYFLNYPAVKTACSMNACAYVGAHESSKSSECALSRRKYVSLLPVCSLRSRILF